MPMYLEGIGVVLFPTGIGLEQTSRKDGDPMASAPAPAARKVAYLIVAFAVATGVLTVLPLLFDEAPKTLLLAGATATGLSGIATAVHTLASASANPPHPTEMISTRGWTPPPPPISSSPRIRRWSGPWFGASLVLAALSLYIPPLGIFLLLTLPMAFRLYRIAVGVALSLMILIVALAALVFVGLWLDSAFDPYECVPQSYASTTCY